MISVLPLEERSISQIYLNSQEPATYVIPVYQRNYAWEEDEITALVKDVFDSLQKDEHAPYYIGTLVTYKRGDNLYEVIDGQQRLTTIFILLKALGIEGIVSRLTYSARKISASTIEKLDFYPQLGEEVDEGIRNGYKFALNAVNAIVNDEQLEALKKFFLDRVHLIHYNVPKDVDLNHYFEVMNSRGEQLEKHEIVKSILSQNLPAEELTTFASVWEACSKMNIYIQQAFPHSDIFGNSFSKFLVSSFSQIPQLNTQQGKKTILEIIQQPQGLKKLTAHDDQNDTFQPIIDFPNFLLIVLKLTLLHSDGFDPTSFILDDKELLNEFNKALKAANNKAAFARQFAFNLLKAKFLLDNYIVHHVTSEKENDGENPWKLQYFFKENSRKKYPKNLSYDNQDIQEELVQLQSMFEVSFTPKTRKNYLFYILRFLFEKEFSTSDYLNHLQNLALTYFQDIYLNPQWLNERNQPKPNAFDAVILKPLPSSESDVNYEDRFNKIYTMGRADIPLFVFNYLDYMLWKEYATCLKGEATKKGSRERNNFFDRLGCSDFELHPFRNFYFSRTRKTLEHYYPQAKAVSDDMDSSHDLTVSQINCLGNFAMIGANANSSGSNWDPKTKLDHYSDPKSDPISVASLKFKIMMQMCQDNNLNILNGTLDRPQGMEWNFDDIQRHQAKMLDILCS